MSVFYAVIFGIIQGITEFLPVSSFGHTGLLRNIFGISGDFSILFGTFLHMGSLLAICLIMRKEIRTVRRESIRLFRDLLVNALIYIRNKRSVDKMGYIRLITSKSRKFTVLILLGTLPTFILGYTGRQLAFIWGLSSVWPAIGFLMTGIVLLVVYLSKAGGHKGISEATLDQAMWVGIVQGLAIFPGISRFALTFSGGLFFGYSRKYALRYSYILSVPAILGSFVYSLTQISARALDSSILLYGFVGMIFAALTGVVCIRFMMKLMKKIPIYIFSLYCFVIGIFSLIYNLN